MVVLAISGSVVALLSAWHIGGLMQETVTENLSSLRAAEELEIALLEQRGLVVSFILDNGNPERLRDLERKKQVLPRCVGLEQGRQPTLRTK